MSNKEISIIDEIINKPLLYLGEKSITRFYYFIFGYTTACLENMQGIALTHMSLAETTKHFRQYIAQKYSEKKTIGWGEILLNASDQKEDMAFDLFVEEWKQFFEENQ